MLRRLVSTVFEVAADLLPLADVAAVGADAFLPGFAAVFALFVSALAGAVVFLVAPFFAMALAGLLLLLADFAFFD